jgi:predicted small lipoprotein YifL
MAGAWRPRLDAGFLYIAGVSGAFCLNRVARINLAALALIATAAGGLGGCGRAGPLEPPPDAQTTAKQTANQSNTDPTLPRAHPKPKPIEAPKQSFFLDPIL